MTFGKASSTGASEMTSLGKLSAFAASRGEGLHPKLRDLVERAAALPFVEVGVRPDGMLQAGPAPRSEQLAAPRKVISFLHERREIREKRK